MRCTPEFRANVRGVWMRHAPRFWWGDRLDARFLAAGAAAGLRAGRVLDIGCNAGVILSQVPAGGLKVGLELAEEPLRIARTLNPDAAFTRGDMLRLPFADASFDAVIFCGMLEVPPSTRKAEAIAEVARVLKPGGTLLMTTLNRRYLRYRHMKERVTLDELRTLLAPRFEARIRGFNPIPPFPYGPPNGILARVPGVWGLLTWLMDRGIAAGLCCSFLVTAVRRPAAHPWDAGRREPSGSAAVPSGLTQHVGGGHE